MRVLIFLILVILPFTCGAKVVLDEGLAVELALKNHPALRASEAKEKSALFDARSVRAERWLNLDLEASYERRSDPVAVVPIKGPGGFPDFSRDIYQWRVVASLPIFEGGVVAKRTQAAKKEALRLKKILEGDRNELAAKTKAVFWQVIYLKELVRLRSEMLEDMKQLYERTKEKFKLGKVSELDLLHIKSALSSERSMLSAAKERLKAHTALLGILTGTEDFVVSGRLDEAKLCDFDGAMRAIYKRPDVREAEIQIEKAKLDLDAEKRRFLPKIFLNCSYGDRAGSGLNGAEEVWSAMVVFKLNLFDSGIKLNRLKKKRALYRAAEYAYRGRLLEAKEELVSAVHRVKEAMSKIGGLKDAVRYAREAYQREKLKYELGRGSVLDVIDSHMLLLRSKLELLGAYLELHLAIVEFERATAQAVRGCSR